MGAFLQIKLTRLAGFIFALAIHVNAMGSSLAIHNSLNDLFDLSLTELMNIEVSVAALTEQKKLYQASSVTVIRREEIDFSAAQTLNDLLMQYVPGYFRAEDKDDTIASFRGVAPDNNGKVMLLVNGIKVNANWFFGPPDALLNSLDLSFIERIEVIRGPGSVTLGQGAQLGVINIITYDSQSFGHDHQQGQTGDSFVKAAEGMWQVGGTTGNHHGDHSWMLHASRLDHRGSDLPNKGWAEEVQESDSSHPNAPADRGNKLNRADGYRLLGDYQYQNLRVQVQHHQQQRDLYNWSKDRDQLEQRLSLIGLDYDHALNQQWSVNLGLSMQWDDYALYDHTTGETTGGAREVRTLANPQLSWTAKNNPINQVVLGIELEQFETGEENWQGDNFIVNRTEQLSSSVNDTNTWVFSDTYQSSAYFIEANWQLPYALRTNLGVRFDEHPQWGAKRTVRGSLFYTLDQDQVVRLSYQEGFRGAPGVHYSGGFLRDGLLSEANFNQLAGTGMTDSSTGELINSLEAPEPELLTVYELGYRGVLSQAFYIDATAYVQEIQDIIVTTSTRNGTPESAVGSDLVGTWGGVFYYTNAPGRLRIGGIETSFIYQQPRWSQQLSISSSHVLEAEDFEFGMKSPVAGRDGNEHSNGIPEQVYRYHGRWQLTDHLSINYHHFYLESWWSPWLNEKESSLDWGQGVAQYRVNRSTQMALAIDNIWQQTGLYPVRARGKNNENSGTPALSPRTISLTLKYHFD